MKEKQELVEEMKPGSHPPQQWEAFHPHQIQYYPGYPESKARSNFVYQQFYLYRFVSQQIDVDQKNLSLVPKNKSGLASIDCHNILVHQPFLIIHILSPCSNWSQRCPVSWRQPQAGSGGFVIEGMTNIMDPGKSYN